MTTIRRHVGACVLGLLVLAAPAFAQEFRIGVVNTDRILRESNPAKAAQAKLEQEFSRREKEVADLGSALKAASDKLEREAPTLAESQRASRQKALFEMERDFQRKRRELNEDLGARKSEEVQQVLDRAYRVIQQVAVQEKYDLVLQEALYISPKHDITEKVIRALNASK